MSKLYYSIGEVAEMFDVNTSLIRFWEKEFKVIKPKKNKKGNRLFTPKDIDNLKRIYQLVKEEGYTLEGAKQRLRNKEEVVVEESAVVITDHSEVIAKLEKIKSALNELRSEV